MNKSYWWSKLKSTALITVTVVVQARASETIGMEILLIQHQQDFEAEIWARNDLHYFAPFELTNAAASFKNSLYRRQAPMYYICREEIYACVALFNIRNIIVIVLYIKKDEKLLQEQTLPTLRIKAQSMNPSQLKLSNKTYASLEANLK